MGEGSIRVMTPAFVLQGEIPVYSSLQITRRHYGVGEFELHLHPRAPNSEQLTHDSILFPVGEPSKAGIIESVETKQGTEDMVVTGYLLKGLAKRRITVPPLSGSNFGWDRFTGDAESVFLHYAAANMTAPENTDRILPGVALTTNQHRGMAALPWQSRFEALDDVFRQIGEYADMGWDIVPDFTQQAFIFTLVPGRELQEGNAGTTRVTISVEMGNASDTGYSKNQMALKNVAYTGGAGEDENRLIQAVGAGTGLARREMWVDAGRIDTAAEVIAMGQRKLKEAITQESISATVLDSGPFMYGRDWDLGDRVTVRAGKARMDARVTEVRESIEQGRIRQLSVTFGTAPITLSGIIRKMTVVVR